MFFIVTKFVDGGDFTKLKLPLPEEIILSYFCQMFFALSYAHSWNIIHTDLKRCYVLLTKDNQIKIFFSNATKKFHKFS